MSDTENNRENISPNQQTFTYDWKEVPIPIPTYPKPHLQPLGEYVLKAMSEAKPEIRIGMGSYPWVFGTSRKSEVQTTTSGVLTSGVIKPWVYTRRYWGYEGTFEPEVPGVPLPLVRRVPEVYICYSILT